MTALKSPVAHGKHSKFHSDVQKVHLCTGHLSLLCHICALGKQVAVSHQKVPLSVQSAPSKIISSNLLTVEVPSIGGACYLLAVTGYVYMCYHWTAHSD